MRGDWSELVCRCRCNRARCTAFVLLPRARVCAVDPSYLRPTWSVRTSTNEESSSVQDGHIKCGGGSHALWDWDCARKPLAKRVQPARGTRRSSFATEVLGEGGGGGGEWAVSVGSHPRFAPFTHTPYHACTAVPHSQRPPAIVSFHIGICSFVYYQHMHCIRPFLPSTC